MLLEATPDHALTSSQLREYELKVDQTVRPPIMAATKVSLPVLLTDSRDLTKKTLRFAALGDATRT